MKRRAEHELLHKDVSAAVRQMVAEGEDRPDAIVAVIGHRAPKFDREKLRGMAVRALAPVEKARAAKHAAAVKAQHDEERRRTGGRRGRNRKES